MDDDSIADAAAVLGNYGIGGVSAADVARLDPIRKRMRRELRTYGHVIVDEAQDLTPMQWRMLARSMPCSGSFTIVGDMGQASVCGSCDELETCARTAADPSGHEDG